MRFLTTTVGLLLVSTRVLAVPVEWTLDNVEFLNPAGTYTPITGAFTYDADTLSVFDVSISGLYGIYVSGTDVSASGTQIVFDGVSSTVLVLEFTSALTNAGGVIDLVWGDAPGTGGLLDNGSQECVGSCLTLLGAGGGTISGSVVPIPAAAWLFGSALAGLGWIRKKQTI